MFAAQNLGGTGGASPDTFAMGAQVWIQVKSVLFTIVLIGVVSFIAYKVVDLLVGLRVSRAEQAGHQQPRRDGLQPLTRRWLAIDRCGGVFSWSFEAPVLVDQARAAIE